MSTAPGSRPTILVVDDEPAIVDLVKLTLESAGYPVLSACDGQQALALIEARSRSIDLLLTDINMPNISGLELACRVSETAPGVPVIFMTGCPADAPHTEFLRREGPFSDCTVIRKPFTPPQLLGEVNDVLATAPR
jgi:two-component system cell cycle sensor histidine kinase/response regulator CckA